MTTTSFELCAARRFLGGDRPHWTGVIRGSSVWDHGGVEMDPLGGRSRPQPWAPMRSHWPAHRRREGAPAGF
jgi:hypothetical protein